ncbi:MULTISPECIES: adenosylhomocysteinase [unclassified Kitasatospora]|uniref:adenosylhomocysteinase n=1 Tax=unclassified Kitasatospora TaxID=2633591 RepID=UPI003825795E
MDETEGRIHLAVRAMPVTAGLGRAFARQRPLAGLLIAADLHLLPSTVPLLLAYREAGARLVVSGSNPASTSDGVARWLARRPGIEVVPDGGGRPVAAALLDRRPDVVIDEADALLGLLHAERPEQLDGLIGACVHTLTGVRRVRGLAARRGLGLPVMAVDGSALKGTFDNRHGTGASALDAVVALTNVSLAGSVTVVVGFGAVGRGIAERARGLGAQVLVTEIDPYRALEAHALGHRVSPLAAAAREATVLITATGSIRVVRAEHLALLPDGAILASAGHGSVEIDRAALAAGRTTRTVRPGVEEFTDPAGRSVLLLADGNPVNTAGGPGHAAAAMDLSFAAQALAVVDLVTRRPPPGLHELDEGIQRQVARLAVEARSIPLDLPSPGHEVYTSHLTGEPERAASDTPER